ncbi:DUF3800 domain-containing protein [Pseudorhodoplanes sp.]|uniref:DUF3800 domain-containing protein n=1 Tax=Pseudorhodoplanes sp. TaxID=1934341 RepID=UPI00391BEBAF
MRRVAPEEDEISDIYLDESSQNRHEYLVLGGLILHKSCTSRFNELIAQARKPELPFGEMKWAKVSRSKLDAYKRVIDFFFDGDRDCKPMEFHSLVVHMPKLKDKVFNKGSREIGFNKDVYQLCMKFARLYRQRLFHVYPDHRNTRSSTEELRSILNFGIRKKGDLRDWPFRRLHFQDSKSQYALQLVDLLIGAVAYRLNRHDMEPGASEPKTFLSQYILHRARIVDVFKDTSIGGKFTIWHRRLR